MAKIANGRYIRSRLEILESPDVQSVENFGDIAHEVGQEVFGEIGDAFQEALMNYPGASKNSLNSNQPYVWSDDPEANLRARRWWFANYPEGRPRTGALGSSWDVKLARIGNLVQLVAQNFTPYMKYVQGTFDRRRAKKYQNPGHRRTGWGLAIDIADLFMDDFNERFTRRFREAITRRRNR